MFFCVVLWLYACNTARQLGIIIIILFRDSKKKEKTENFLSGLGFLPSRPFVQPQQLDIYQTLRQQPKTTNRILRLQTPWLKTKQSTAQSHAWIISLSHYFCCCCWAWLMWQKTWSLERQWSVSECAIPCADICKMTNRGKPLLGNNEWMITGLTVCLRVKRSHAVGKKDENWNQNA